MEDSKKVRKRAGRPQFNPTAEQRSDVELMAADGTSIDCIAAIIGIQKQTLAKHFADEISLGRARKRLHYLKSLEKQSDGGNASATKTLLAMTDLVPERAAKQEKLGKKEIAKAAAEGASGTTWDELLAPADQPLQ